MTTIMEYWKIFKLRKNNIFTFMERKIRWNCHRRQTIWNCRNLWVLCFFRPPFTSDFIFRAFQCWHTAARTHLVWCLCSTITKGSRRGIKGTMIQWRMVGAHRPRSRPRKWKQRLVSDRADIDWYLMSLCSSPTPPSSASLEVGLASESGLVTIKVSYLGMRDTQNPLGNPFSGSVFFDT